MKKNIILVFVLVVTSFYTTCFSQIKFNYSAYFTEPEKHYIEVELNIENSKVGETDFILPVWTPGYYEILDSPKNIVDFNVKNSNNEAISWYKKLKNHWVVKNQYDKNFTITYRYFANQKSVAESNVDGEKAFIMPNNVFMHVKHNLQEPVTLKITPYKSWKTISTGLTEKDSGIFYANNFDMLYDSPIYIGSPYTFAFNHEGKQFSVSIAKPDGLIEEQLTNDLKRIISATTSLMQHVPYTNYSFIMMEAGGGGLEHWNSQAVFTGGSFNFEDKSDYIDFLNFITHEYFHLYNVKAIRPIELGPFDYSKENYTNMLWVSEGLTVYYEYIIMMRAGLLEKFAAFDYLSSSIKRYENIEGKNHMSLARSSFDIWLNFFNHNSNASETTISYYNKGPIIGFLLDLKIRNSTKNEKSLDDVMRFLYNEYYLKQNRGFKEEEFWKVCETIAENTMEGIKEYVYTTNEIDYQKFLNYAGLEIDLSPIKGEQNNVLIKRVFNISEKKQASKIQMKIRNDIFLVNKS
ncbi:hypothetical protein VP395_12090 [Mariniflexile soesokkakense]|uniref:Metalloprotease with PDZ domain n=1 Tax=Mariniflexile soesokkakense TaxID=1343160 RepID=A0ABV0ABJ0_9FLAO